MKDPSLLRLTAAGLVECLQDPARAESLTHVVIYLQQDSSQPSPIATETPSNGSLSIPVPMPSEAGGTLVFSIPATTAFPGVTAPPVTLAP